MANTKTVSFRCPDDMLSYIEQQSQKPGLDKTSVIMKLLEAGKAALGNNVTVSQPSDGVRQMVEKLIAPLQAQLDERQQENKTVNASQPSDDVRQMVEKLIAPLQMQLDDLRGKLIKPTQSTKRLKQSS